MKLGKLLAAGKSMAWGWGEESRYRMVKPLCLPKFISPKNPFVPPAEKPAADRAATAPLQKVAAAEMTKTQKLPELHSRRKTVPAWADKLNPFSMLRASRSPARKNAGPMQPELSLERVKVLQNDLRDADVEIVPIKSRRIAEPV